MASVQNFSNGSSSNQNNFNSTTAKANPDQLYIVDCESDDSDSFDSKTEKVIKPNESCKIQPVLDIPINTGPSQSLDQVSVIKSKNIHFGAKTYFNGPVTIKQFIENKAVENKAYVQTEQENITTNVNSFHNVQHPPVQTDQHCSISQKKIVLRIWHKVLLLMLCVILTGAALSVAIFKFYPKNEEDAPETPKTPFSAVYNVSNDEILLVVVAYWYLNWCLNNSFLFIVGIIILCVTVFSLIIMEDEQNVTETTPSIIAQISSYEGDRRVPLLIAPNHLRIVPREEWLAQPPEFALDPIKHPVPWVIIAHTAAEPCETQSECIFRVRLIQNYHVESRNWYDIGYNYLVGGDGSAYYGRGWDYIGAHTKGYNNISMGIAFIGTFTREAPPQQQLDACQKLIALGVKEGKIAKDYKLLAHRQLMSTRSPGDKLYEILKTWPHFVHEGTDVKDILPRQI